MCDGPGTLSPWPGAKRDVPAALEQRSDQGSCSWREPSAHTCTWGSGKMGTSCHTPRQDLTPGTLHQPLAKGCSSPRADFRADLPLAERLKPLLAQLNSRQDKSPCTHLKNVRKYLCSRNLSLPCRVLWWVHSPAPGSGAAPAPLRSAKGGEWCRSQ